MNSLVKAIFLIIIFIIYSSCNENTNNPPTDSDKIQIQIVDSISNTEKFNYKIELYYVLERFDSSFNILRLNIYPIPVIDDAAIEFIVDKITKSEIHIVDLIDTRHSLYMKDSLKKGKYLFQYKFLENEKIKHGFYRLYLSQGEIIVDSLNILYCTKENIKLISLDKVYPAISGISNKQGILEFSRNILKWNGEGFFTLYENGVTSSYIKITNNFFIKIYDVNSNIVYEGLIGMNKLSMRLKIPV